ncbi:hypothetical protein QX216_22280 [Vibrio parahaemolyticus]|uniref:hypothetical protein n=1 Tax=Vibrio TaxID=662 RepID=UPI001EFE21E1|nr:MULTISPECIES: hypothetical protein [Vibrio]MCG9559651.1 hypothetical protein [Vibrio kanaloae]MDS1796825.1 hypothetical protein [Vibrio parahaemolyticus]MDS1944812.1 hypothetical protein [Vibrio parahaemolyticus]
MSGWESLSEGTQDVFRDLGTRNPKVISKISTARLTKAIREAQFYGYDDCSPFNWLIFEYERRKTQRNWTLAIVGLIIAIVGIIASLIK